MRVLSLLAIATASLAHASAAAAESPWKNAVEIGARVGYGVPLGAAVRDLPMRDAVAAKVPLWIDAGYRFQNRYYLGGYLAYAFGTGSPVSRTLCEGHATECSLRVLRFGANARVHFAPESHADPWIGLGFGYEIVVRRELNTSLRGFELANVQAGADLRLGDELVVGPFVAASLARYSVVAVTRAYDERRTTLAEPTMHGWLVFGVRGAFRTLI